MHGDFILLATRACTVEVFWGTPLKIKFCLQWNPLRWNSAYSETPYDEILLTVKPLKMTFCLQWNPLRWNSAYSETP